MPLISTLGVMNATGFGFAANKRTPAVIITPTQSPFVYAYPFNVSQGFGTKYADPTTLPAASSSTATGSLSFNNAGTLVAIAHNSTTPYISIYPWSNGFGTKYANLATPVIFTAASFNFDSSAIAVSVSATPFLSAYRWNNGFGTKYIDAASAIAAQSIKFSNSGYIVTGASSAPYENAYPFNSSTGFGTRYANPSTAVSGRISGVAINPTSTSILFSQSTGTPFISAYAWSNGFSTKYAAPSTAPTSGSYSAFFNPTGTEVGVSSLNNAYIYPWNNSTGFGTRYASATLSPNSYLAMNYQGTAIGYVSSTGPFVGAYNWTTGIGLGTAFANPSTLPPATVNEIIFTPY